MRRSPSVAPFFELMARFELTDAQAERFYVIENRAAAGIDASDADLLANPYLLFERDRRCPEPISVWTIDRGAFPVPAVRDAHPLPEPSRIDDPTDRKRVRALVIEALETAVKDGAHSAATLDDRHDCSRLPTRS